MKNKQLIACLWALMAMASTGSAKEWRGIVPLKSTRADVARRLGAVNDDRLATYYLPNETVFVQFSKQPCDEKVPYEEWDVAPGTVIRIRVITKKQTPLADLHINLAKFKKVQGDDDVVGHFYYVNEKEGFSIEVGQDLVIGYIYEPTKGDNHLRCHSVAAAKKPCGSSQKN